MAEVSTEQTLQLPARLIKLCHWFWAKQPRLWCLLGSNIFTLLIWLVGSLLVTNKTTLKTLPLQGIIENIAHNGLVYTLILLLLFFILLSFTFISYLIGHMPIPAPSQVLPAELQEEQKEQQEKHDLKRAYLRYLQAQVKLLPSLGLGVSDLIAPQGVPLADVFIPLQFRESPKALKLHPLEQGEIKAAAGLDRQHADYLLLDAKGEWERTFMQRDRLDIATLWDLLSPERPAAVLQGSPGMGKSTLLARIALSLASQQLGEPDTRLMLTPPLLPLLVLIKEYADYLEHPPVAVAGTEQAHQRSLQAFLAYDIERKLQQKGVAAACDIAQQVEQWLKTCQCLVMFDGLDEVSDKALLREIQQAIHDFIEQQRHPDVQAQTYNRFLITSRVAEYDAPALEGYRYFLVAELSLEQIKAFLPCWYRASITVSAAEVAARTEKLTADLINASEKNAAVRKLAENPLLLTLMAVMLHNGTQLPERRVELYQAVTKTLLESRNAVKGLPELYEDEAIQRLGPLAFTMQERGNSLARRSEVEAAIKQAIASPLGSGAYSEQQVAAEVAAYVESIGRRGGLFVLRTGDYYGFMHRSFQEYFAARHMLREIEGDRQPKIKAFVRLVREHPNTWREPFILAVASKSAGDSGPLASMMIRALLSPKQAPALRDILLAATCVIEAKYVNIDNALQRDIAEHLLSHYEQAQKELHFEDCKAIERVVRDWLLVLRAQEAYLELPHALQRAISDTQHPELQRATLTLLTMIVEKLLPARYDIHALLIPSLLALAGLDSIGDYRPAPQLSVVVNFVIADLALAVLTSMGQRGPAGLLLKEQQHYFKDNPQQLRDLALYSLACGTLITPTLIPWREDNYQRYEAAIGAWIQLRDSYKQARITEQNIVTCLGIQQTLLDCAEEASYPIALHLPALLQQAAGHSVQWQDIWQSHLLEQLDSGRYISYQEVALFWTALFPAERDLQMLVDRMLVHYNGTQGPQQRYVQCFLSFLSRDLRDLRYLRDLRDLRDLRYFRYVRYFRELGELRDLRYFRDLRDLKYFRYFRDLMLTQNIAEKISMLLPSHDNLEDIDLLTILMGRILQIQEQKATGKAVETEVQRLMAVVLGYLVSGSVDTEPREAVLDVVRYLPARTANEVRFVLQTINGTADSGVHAAGAYALRIARPKDTEAWQELEQGKLSSVGEVRKAVEEALQRRK